jgi:hypothetical protein
MTRLLRRLFLLVAGRRTPKGGQHRAAARPAPRPAPPTVDDAFAAMVAAEPELARRLRRAWLRRTGPRR